MSDRKEEPPEPRCVPAESLQVLDTGPANHRCIATTKLGVLFTKVPRKDCSSAHQGPWKEFIVSSLARRLGIPTLDPYAVRVDRKLLDPKIAENVAWESGPFFANPWQAGTRQVLDYGSVGLELRTVLYVLDVWTANIDRALADCWRADDGRVVITDYEMVALPEGAEHGWRADLFDWSLGGFLVRQVGRSVVEPAIRRIDALQPSDVEEAVQSAADIWAGMPKEHVLPWLDERRQSVFTAFIEETKKTESTPPWWKFGDA